MTVPFNLITSKTKNLKSHVKIRIYYPITRLPNSNQALNLAIFLTYIKLHLNDLSAGANGSISLNKKHFFSILLRILPIS